jgi:hypothetical protein
MPPLGLASSLGLGAPRAATSSGSVPPASGTSLGNAAVVANTATLEAETGQDEAFVAYNDETFQLWISSTGTEASVTFYAKQDS